MDKVQKLVTIQAQKISELKALIAKLEEENSQMREVIKEYQLAYLN